VEVKKDKLTKERNGPSFRRCQAEKLRRQGWGGVKKRTSLKDDERRENAVGAMIGDSIKKRSALRCGYGFLEGGGCGGGGGESRVCAAIIEMKGMVLAAGGGGGPGRRRTSTGGKRKRKGIDAGQLSRRGMAGKDSVIFGL